MSKLNLFVRSTLFWLFSVSFISVYCIVCLAAIPFSLETRHAAIRVFLRIYLFVLRKLCGISYNVTGLEHIPNTSRAIVLCKHQSAFETFCLPLIFQNPAIIVKRELLWVPCYGWGLATSKPISINRSDKHSSMQQIIDQGTRCLADNRWIVIFPEGTRIPYGKTAKYHLGGARLAIATETDVLPVAHNAGKFWPKRSFIKYPGVVHIHIGQLISSKNKTPEQLTNEVKTWIEDEIKIMDRATPAI